MSIFLFICKVNILIYSGFISRYNMNQHIREIHNNPNEVPQTGDFRAGVETVACEDCGKVLADPSSLYRHRKIHVREKPHKCPFCEK